MFNLHNYVKKTIEGMIGNYPDFQVMEYSLNWYSKGVLNEDDLAEIEGLIENRNTSINTELEFSDEPITEVEDDTEDDESEADELSEDADGEPLS